MKPHRKFIPGAVRTSGAPGGARFYALCVFDSIPAPALFPDSAAAGGRAFGPAPYCIASTAFARRETLREELFL